MEFHNYYKEMQGFYLVEFHDIDKVFILSYNKVKIVVVFHEKKRRAMILCFAGHSLVPHREYVKRIVKEQIRKNVFGNEHILCYLG